MSSVLQPWVEDIPMMMQSTLVLSLRGPDTHRCPEIKKIQRWMRGLVFRPGNPDSVGQFMADISELPELIEKGPLARELEFVTQHFYSHLMHGLQVIGLKIPDMEARNTAYTLYAQMSYLFHLRVETKEQFENRLSRNQDKGKLP